jgi:hypothetical protein
MYSSAVCACNVRVSHLHLRLKVSAYGASLLGVASMCSTTIGELQESRHVKTDERHEVVVRASQKGLPCVRCMNANDDANNLIPGP